MSIFNFISKMINKESKTKVTKKSYNNYNQTKATYQSTTDIAVFFNIKANELNQVFTKLKWAEQSGKWWIATARGRANGAKQEYNKKTKIKYVSWDTSVKMNNELIKEVTEFKNATKTVKAKEKPKRMTQAEKKEKGDSYEEYVSNFFREQGYYVWEHGKEKGMLDSSIDLFVKKSRYVYFVQCKNWEKWKIDHKEVKATRTDIREYLKTNKELFQLIKHHELKILYVTAKECLTKSAYKYIEENSDIVEYQIIPVLV